MRLKKIILGTVAAVMATTLSAFPLHDDRMFQNPECSPFYEVILTDAQKSEIKQLRTELMSAMEAIMESSSFPLAAALENGKFDTEAYVTTSEATFKESVRLHAHYEMLIYNVLTDEQKTLFGQNVLKIASDETCRPPKPMKR